MVRIWCSPSAANESGESPAPWTGDPFRSLIRKPRTRKRYTSDRIPRMPLVERACVFKSYIVFPLKTTGRCPFSLGGGPRTPRRSTTGCTERPPVNWRCHQGRVSHALDWVLLCLPVFCFENLNLSTSCEFYGGRRKWSAGAPTHRVGVAIIRAGVRNAPAW